MWCEKFTRKHDFISKGRQNWSVSACQGKRKIKKKKKEEEENRKEHNNGNNGSDFSSSFLTFNFLRPLYAHDNYDVINAIFDSCFMTLCFRGMKLQTCAHTRMTVMCPGKRALVGHKRYSGLSKI